MSEIERIIMECRYLISLNKSLKELAKICNVNEDIVYDDLNNKLPKYDKILYQRVNRILKTSHN